MRQIDRLTTRKRVREGGSKRETSEREEGERSRLVARQRERERETER